MGTGLFTGCSLALVAAIILIIHARDILKSEGREQYMNNIFPLYRYTFSLFTNIFRGTYDHIICLSFYSLFGLVVLHMLMFSGNIYFWRRFRVHYSFIFGLKPGTELGYREVLLLSSGLTVLTLAAILANLDMDMDPRTRSYKAITELLPLGLVIVSIYTQILGYFLFPSLLSIRTQKCRAL